MDITACIKKVERYLSKENVQPMIVDVQNREDMAKFIAHYNVSGNTFFDTSAYCNSDEYPKIDVLLEELARVNCNVFVARLSSFLKLHGEQSLRSTLSDILGMAATGHIVIITYQCGQYLSFRDPRLSMRICVVDGSEDPMPNLVFSSDIFPAGGNVIYGIDRVAAEVERCSDSPLYIKTGKRKVSFPFSLYPITEMDSAYDVLLQYDRSTAQVGRELGSDKQWAYALEKFNNSWAETIDAEFGNKRNLDLAFSSFLSFDADKRWLYFIGLRMFGAQNSWCLNEIAKSAAAYTDIPRRAYRSLLSVPHNDTNFEACYRSRKSLLEQMGNPSEEACNFCSVVLSKKKDAIYYLTDNTQKEKETIFFLLDKYGSEYTRDEVLSALSLVYPDLHQYLSPYHFGSELLDGYFQEYKYQKVLNHIFPEFEEIVKEQSEKREYNLLLGPRTSKIESIDRAGAQLYFVDALGVEFLSYITSVCKELSLRAHISVCSCELPSITSANKEFLDLFEDSDFPVVNIKDIDEIKHHGKHDFDYQRTKLPIHLSIELDIIRELLTKIKDCLTVGHIRKAILVADHGASRLAVIHETENTWEMSSKGIHSGRCCLKSDVDKQPDYATDAGDFWALANYDRFKGGRKANVEVHGGATLEEVAVPIIELTYSSTSCEVFLLPVDSTTIIFGEVPVIEVSYRKKAAIKIFATEKLQDVSLRIGDNFYPAAALDDNFYIVEMPDIKKAKTYSVDVYADGEIIAQKLLMTVKKEGTQEKDLL